MTQTAAEPAVVAPPSPRPTKPRKPFRYRKAIAIFIVPFAALFAAFYLTPILYAVFQSLQKVEREGTFGAPTQVFGGLSQYALVFQNTEFWSSIGRVLLFGVVQVPVMLLLALLFALLLDSPLLRGKRFFRLAFFAPYAVPGVIAAIMWGYLYSPSLSPFSAVTSRAGLLDGGTVLWAVANVVTWVFVGYNMLIIYSSLLAIPTEIYEAARLDGASQWRIAVAIKIPLVVPAIVLTAVFSVIGTLQLLTRTAGLPPVHVDHLVDLHAEHARLLDVLGAQLQPRGGLQRRPRGRHVHPLDRVPPVDPAEGPTSDRRRPHPSRPVVRRRDDPCSSTRRGPPARA